MDDTLLIQMVLIVCLMEKIVKPLIPAYLRLMMVVLCCGFSLCFLVSFLLISIIFHRDFLILSFLYVFLFFHFSLSISYKK